MSWSQSDFDDIYPMLYGHGVSLGIKLAFETPVTERLMDTRGRLCPCQGDRAVHRGFKAGWSAVRKVRNTKQMLGS